MPKVRHFMHYDERYLEDSKNTEEELYYLQQLIMDTTHSNDLGRDIQSLGIYDKKEIETALSMYFKSGKINRERVGLDGNIVIFRYFTKN